jgi:hypothetical protein
MSQNLLNGVQHPVKQSSASRNPLSYAIYFVAAGMSLPFVANKQL